MSLSDALSSRCGGSCELCKSTDMLQTYIVPNSPAHGASIELALCSTCVDDINADIHDASHWRCLNETMWSEVPAAQVMAYRLLKKLDVNSWAQDALDMLYLEEDLKHWAEEGLQADKAPTLDSNGVKLTAGDSVTLIKDLNVKGANFTAKRGTAVRNISLSDNPEHIEGRVNGQRIVIIAAYVKKNS
jgi:protein PhnA